MMGLPIVTFAASRIVLRLAFAALGLPIVNLRLASCVLCPSVPLCYKGSLARQLSKCLLRD